jgi:hemerythrin-like domain-containing protein
VTPSANLLEDHAHILAALDAIDRALRDIPRGRRNVELFEAALAFIRDYADGAHYAKEELLFAAVLAQMSPCAAGPVGCLRLEHDATNLEADRMARAIAAIRAGDDARWFDLADAHARYAAIIRVHIPKENGGFFPMSDMLLPQPVQADLAARFAAIDRALPATFEDAARALRQHTPAPPAPPAHHAPHRFVDRFLLYDARLASALDHLAGPPRRR